MSITTIIGPMFSGKTTEFIRLIERKKLAGKKCLIIKHLQDNRFEEIDAKEKHVITHNKIKYKNCDIVYNNDLMNEKFLEYVMINYDIVGVEEGFFFNNLAIFCNYLANENIEVIVSTIDSSYKQEIPQEIGKLIAISENLIKLKAVCMQCKNTDASFTIRTTDDEQDILIGGSDMYQSVCRPCLNQDKKRRIESKDVCIKKKLRTN
ncbi:thymidine kinase-like protein [Moumouvirus goulette]|uniref:Thymidine kinase n=1 Tax=Moumouvirus goulette TaxID=1247379 RepID=M1PNA5_9VIRU|nr:thymidine kinase-like protein [Moumouvirus goulette]AGF85466.1 thymidine kinase-like protein [Moumouvirus goulette]